jgi:hypothetical protein
MVHDLALPASWTPQAAVEASRLRATQALRRKIFLFLFFRKYVYISASRLIEKGRTRRHDT